jgi:hypothetical protein
VYLLDRWIVIPFRGPDGGVKAGALDEGSLILIPPDGLPTAFLAFFEGVGLADAFHLLALVLEATTPTLVEVSLEDSSLGGWVKTGMAGNNTSPSKPPGGWVKTRTVKIGTSP